MSILAFDRNNRASKLALNGLAEHIGTFLCETAIT